MSINSMTGYGEGIVSKSGITIQTEISSVNKKQLDKLNKILNKY